MFTGGHLSLLKVAHLHISNKLVKWVKEIHLFVEVAEKEEKKTDTLVIQSAMPGCGR